VDSIKYKIIKLLNKAKRALASFYLVFFKENKLKKEEEGESRHRSELDKKLVYSFSKSKIPSLKQVKYVKKFLTARELFVLQASVIIFFLSFIFLGTRFYFTHLQIVPAQGGTYAEGLVGNPKYINPLYAGLSDVDSDLSGLMFSALLKRDNDGRLVNDLADNYSVSEDGKIYNFKIKTGAKWHNNNNLTIDDIIFSFNIIKDAKYNSPLKKNFSGAEIEKIDEENLKFILAEPYAAFLELLTFGIMPQDLWYAISPAAAPLAELNLKPIGSGPYKFKSLTKDTAGQIKSYNLAANEDYYGQEAKIENLNFVFSPNFEEAVRALNEGAINGISYLPKSLEKDLIAQDSLNLYKLNLPQLTAAFFNQAKNSALKEKAVRVALALSLDKNGIINNSLGGNARLIDGPILPDNFAYNENNKKYDFNKEEAIKLLEDAGWKETKITEADIAAANEDIKSDDDKIKIEAEKKLAVGVGNWRIKDGGFLKVKLTTVASPENSQVAQSLKKGWEEIGIKTEVEEIQPNQIDANIIRPRNFEILLYGQILGADPDLYAFWHSSQMGESGLNLSNYANKEVDQLLEGARVSADLEKRKEEYKKFQEIITEDLPAIFLYSPTYTYAQSKKIKGFGVKSILIPGNRFANITDWYMKTKKKLTW
jgi:peptide/nickel transport system substrate-binding protein